MGLFIIAKASLGKVRAMHPLIYLMTFDAQSIKYTSGTFTTHSRASLIAFKLFAIHNTL